jgi:predicted lactoylglutathione lyase
MASQMFVNLPVKDLQRSVAFFTELGFSFDENMTDERATAMIVNDGAYVMLLTEPFFEEFTKRPVADATGSTEVIVALTADSPAAVDELVTKALAAGGSPSNDRSTDGPMYVWSFQDPDGHLWEVFHFDVAALAGP